MNENKQMVWSMREGVEEKMEAELEREIFPGVIARLFPCMTGSRISQG